MCKVNSDSIDKSDESDEKKFPTPSGMFELWIIVGDFFAEINKIISKK